MSVHNHAPWRPMCNERRLPSGQLRGACLADDGRPATPTTNPAAAATRAELTAEQED